MTSREFAVHVAVWWWDITVGPTLCGFGLHAWTDAGNRPTCRRCPEGDQ